VQMKLAIHFLAFKRGPVGNVICLRNFKKYTDFGDFSFFYFFSSLFSVRGSFAHGRGLQKFLKYGLLVHSIG